MCLANRQSNYKQDRMEIAIGNQSRTKGRDLHTKKKKQKSYLRWCNLFQGLFVKAFGHFDGIVAAQFCTINALIDIGSITICIRSGYMNTRLRKIKIPRHTKKKMSDKNKHTTNRCCQRHCRCHRMVRTRIYSPPRILRLLTVA